MPTLSRRRRNRFWDNHRGPIPCCYCGRLLRMCEATIEHIVPRARGGSDDMSNLRIACALCNMQRGTKPFWKYWYERRRQLWLFKEVPFALVNPIPHQPWR